MAWRESAGPRARDLGAALVLYLVAAATGAPTATAERKPIRALRILHRPTVFRDARIMDAGQLVIRDMGGGNVLVRKYVTDALITFEAAAKAQGKEDVWRKAQETYFKSKEQEGLCLTCQTALLQKGDRSFQVPPSLVQRKVELDTKHNILVHHLPGPRPSDTYQMLQAAVVLDDPEFENIDQSWGVDIVPLVGSGGEGRIGSAYGHRMLALVGESGVDFAEFLELDANTMDVLEDPNDLASRLRFVRGSSAVRAKGPSLRQNLDKVTTVFDLNRVLEEADIDYELNRDEGGLRFDTTLYPGNRYRFTISDPGAPKRELLYEVSVTEAPGWGDGATSLQAEDQRYWDEFVRSQPSRPL